MSILAIFKHRCWTQVVRLLAATAALSACVLLTACSGGSPKLAGVWLPDDGSGVKTISQDGACSGMYYHNGRPLDIGGGMTCILGDKNSAGAYTLVVRQPPNERTYTVRFTDDDTLVLSGADGVNVTLTRQ